MYSARKLTVVAPAVGPEPTEQILALVARMRALSATDKKLAQLIEDLEPHLPKAASTIQKISENFETGCSCNFRYFV